MEWFVKKRAAWLSRWAVILYLLSFLIVRLHIVQILDFNWHHSVQAGLHFGFGYDIGMAFFLWGLAGFARFLPWAPLQALGLVFLFFTWLAVAGNALYFKFFNTPLELWVVKMQWRDLFVVGDSAGSMFAHGPLALSFLCFLGAAVGWWRGIRARPAVLRQVGRIALLVTVGLTFKQQTLLMHSGSVGRYGKGSVLSSNVLLKWWYESKGKMSKFDFAGPTVPLRSAKAARAEAIPLLKSFRDLAPKPTLADLHPPAIPVDPHASLLRTLQPKPEEVKALRKALGLPTDGKPLSVVILFVESLRSFELLHPEIGPQIFPRLRHHLESHGIWYKQAYSSAFTAAQTVRGQFTTLCSMLPNPGGPAPYIAYPTLKVECLASLFKKRGYRTLWMNGYRSDYHNKGFFESVHGTDHFFDIKYWESKGVKEYVGSWGVGDRAWLPVAFKDLEHQHSLGPIFANVLTVSTHHPFSEVPGIVLPPGLREATKKFPEYRGYLSRLRYADEALGDFLDSWFAADWTKDTLLIVKGDHSTVVLPHLPLTTAQQSELWSRITFGIFSRGLKKPLVSEQPIHQLDVAPTIANIVGGDFHVAWIGRPILEATGGGTGLRTLPGSALVYEDQSTFRFRWGLRLCHVPAGATRTECDDVPYTIDPMFTPVKVVQEDTVLSSYFRSVNQASREAIHHNLIMTEEDQF